MIPSRIERTSPDGRFAVAFGVDHVTGSYCQVWRAPMSEQEGAFLILDNQGVGFDRRAALRELDADLLERVRRFVAMVRARFAQAADAGNPYPNMDHGTVSSLFALFGFVGGLAQEVFDAFD